MTTTTALIVKSLAKARALFGWDGDQLDKACLIIFEIPFRDLTGGMFLILNEWFRIHEGNPNPLDFEVVSESVTVADIPLLNNHGLPNNWHTLIAINNADIKRLGMNSYMASWHLKKKYPPKYSRRQLTDQQLYDWVFFCHDWANSLDLSRAG
jgi:hypothetical protein